MEDRLYITFDSKHGTYNIMEGDECIMYSNRPEVLTGWLKEAGYRPLLGNHLVYIKHN